jgi:hypothetical protein
MQWGLAFIILPLKKLKTISNNQNSDKEKEFPWHLTLKHKENLKTSSVMQVFIQRIYVTKCFLFSERESRATALYHRWK